MTPPTPTPTPQPDLRQTSQACLRNREPIGDALTPLLREGDLVFELGAGTGQHAVDFAGRFPFVTWQPADRPENHPSIAAWRDFAGLPNLLPVLGFDLFDETAPLAKADLVLAINVLHIAPEPASRHLFRHAARLLGPGGLVVVYGPFRYPDRELEPSNVEFERWLQSVDPARGLREVTTLDGYAAAHGFAFEGDLALPANNHLRWWRKG